MTSCSQTAVIEMERDGYYLDWNEENSLYWGPAEGRLREGDMGEGVEIEGGFGAGIARPAVLVAR